ncbi:MAG: hypothetical protein M1828_006978 [Chrysothrix sp. TS-e1954]|nr:MAG: hypothetical protein M1828_006978 [Chrysothrix sp. TS-e1954]
MSGAIMGHDPMLNMTDVMSISDRRLHKEMLHSNGAASSSYTAMQCTHSARYTSSMDFGPPEIKVTGGTATSVDPEEERLPPPDPTILYFPQDEIKLKSNPNWAKRLPNLKRRFASITKPSDIKEHHLQALNVSVENEVELDDLVPSITGQPPYLPPKEWTQQAATARKSSAVQIPLTQHKHFMLGNDHKAPDMDAFVKYSRELTCTTTDGLRAIGKRKPRPGHAAPNITHFRDFWARLELLSQYWETSSDHYYTSTGSAPPSPTHSKGLKRLSIFSSKDSLTESNHHKTDPGRRYKGFRKSTGSKMPESYRIDAVRSLVRTMATLFQCQITPPKRPPHLEIRTLMIPVTQTSVVWRTPANKEKAKRGILEGPVLAVQCRAETGFVKDPQAVVLDVARELAGILMLAQERAREGKPRETPGVGEWYTTKPRWGGGPGGEFGEAEGNKDWRPPASASYYSALAHKPTEEELWKRLDPGKGPWEPKVTYLAVGKDREVPEDKVFMLSSIYHHVSIMRLDVHPVYIEYLLHGQQASLDRTNTSWSSPRIQRTRWYDLLSGEDRGELFRALWGILSYQMRSGQAVSQGSDRHASDTSQLFSLRRKSLAPKESQNLTSQRSHSVAF